jgi:hypothetical protein
VACRRAGVGDAALYKMAVVNVIGNYAGILQSSDLTETSTATAV